MDGKVSVLGKLFSENALGCVKTGIADDSDPITCNAKLQFFPNVHSLIMQASERLAAMEYLSATTNNAETDTLCSQKSQVYVKRNNVRLEHSDSDACIHALAASEVMKNNKRGVPQHDAGYLESVLIKRMNKFHCSECIFCTESQEAFHNHFKRFHLADSVGGSHLTKQSQLSKMGHSELKYMYRCSLCTFVALKMKGFKIHCSSKHSELPYTKILKYMRLNHPKAKSYFSAYIDSMKECAQKRHAQARFQTYFVKDNPKVFSDKRNLLKLPTTLKSCLAQQKIPCMLCFYEFSYPNMLEKHYSEAHKTCGPWRCSTDQLFHCAKCSFCSISYKALHHHFADQHRYDKVAKKATADGNVSHAETDLTSPTTIMQNDAVSRSVSYDSGASESLLRPSQSTQALTLDNAKCPCDANKDGACRTNSELKPKLQCNKCAYSCCNIRDFLNHFRTDHKRQYPAFVANHIQKVCSQNLVIVEIPEHRLGNDWINGWMNKECTDIISRPVFTCGLCEYSSSIFNTIWTHYNSRHPGGDRSIASMGVVELEENRKQSICSRGNKLFQCTECKYTTVFHQTIVQHYRSTHKKIKLTDQELESVVCASTVEWCVKCNAAFSNLCLLSKHIELNHLKDVVNFSFSSGGSFRCHLCDSTMDTMSDLIMHLEKHIESNIDHYNQHYLLAFCCSKCRRVFRGERCLRHHFTRMHIEWSENSFMTNEIPSEFFSTGKNHLGINIVPAGNAPPERVVTNIKIETSLTKTESTPLPDSRTRGSEYVCVWCPFCTRDGNTMRRHLRVNHHRYVSSKRLERLKEKRNKNGTFHGDVDANDPATVPTSNKLVLTCPQAKHASISPNAYSNHVKQRHNDVNPFQCPHCRKRYLCETVLRMHTKKKHKFPGVSKVVDVTYVGKKITNGVRTSCLHRSKYVRPGTSHSFQKHVETAHSFDKPYHCQHCPNKFLCASVYLSHLRKSHHIFDSNIPLESHKKALNDKEKPCGIKVEADKQSPPDMAEDVTVLNSTLPHPAKTSVELARKRKQTKDYQHPRSVRVAPGQWKCVYCVEMLLSYAELRKHLRKAHPYKQLLRCRWCDFTCKTHIQRSKHDRIHAKYISNRMKELRRIWQDQKENNLKSLNKKNKNRLSVKSEAASCQPKNLEERETDLAMPVETENTSEAAKFAPNPVKVTPKARKTIGCSVTRIKTPVQLYSKSSSCTSLRNGYRIYNDGRLGCKFCSHMTIDVTRMLIHIRAKHVKQTNFNCQLCSYVGDSYKTIHHHLLDYHKLEKNHHLAVDVSLEVNAEEKPNITEHGFPRGPGRPPKYPRTAHFAPRPSLDTVSRSDDGPTDSAWNRLKEGVNQQYMRLEMPPRPETTSNGSEASSEKVFKAYGDVALRAVPQRTLISERSGERFKCTYCNVEACSTYEMEYHMRRHEIAAVETHRFMDNQSILSRLTSIGNFTL